MSLWQHLDALDRSAFLAINGAHAPWADGAMWTISDIRLWIPLYVFFIVVIQRRYGWRGLGIAVPVIAVMMVCADTGSVLLFKNTVQRLRPSHVEDLQSAIHLLPSPDGVPYRGGQFGFVSSHASNHFAIALFMIGLLRGVPRWAAFALITWAALICYSRIYLGVHYPGDILAGALYGAVIGCGFAWLYQRIVRKPSAA